MKVISIAILFLLFFPLYAFSDMGAIVPDEEVSLTEPAQRAIIAHDRFREILILSTNFDTQKDVKAVRFIPFPSKVEIREGKSDIFENLGKLIKKYNLHYLTFYRGGEPKREGVEIISTETLGPHKVIQVKVNDFSDFKKWVRDLFEKEGISKEGFTKKEEEIVIHYLKNSINYFVFDIVDLKEGINSITPLIYKFNTAYFYYPLVTSSLFPGKGTIELFIFSNCGEPLQRIRGRRSETAVVSWGDMEKIDPSIARLMGEHAVFGALKYVGAYSDLKADIWFKLPVYELKPYNPLLKKEKER